jgi:hypothetical protein
MSLFPTRILLATDSFEEAQLPPLGPWTLPKEPTQSCTWCTSEWYPLCW